MARDEYELREAAHIFGWWVGGGPVINQWFRMAKDKKILAFFGTFSRITKSQRKSLFYEGEIGLIEKKIFQRRIRYFLNFLAIKTF